MTFRELCQFYAPTVKAPPGVDPYALLYALGMAESSGGTFNITRYEKSYHSGRYAVPALIEKFGAAAACSYGPWQIMYVNATDVLGHDVDPIRLHIPEVAAVASIRWLNEHVIGRGAVTVRDIADAWNTGNHRDANVPHAYIAKVERWYGEAAGTD